MQKRKDVLTTGQVAQICNVAPRTVTKWFDSGKLRGYRIPGSKDRRIPFNELIRFMKTHSIPTDSIEKGAIRILVIDSDHIQASRLAQSLLDKGSFDIQTASTGFDAGLLAQKFLPNIILINLLCPEIDAQQLCAHIHRQEDLKDCKIIALAGSLSQAEIQALCNKGFHAAAPADSIENILKTIQQMYSIL